MAEQGLKVEVTLSTGERILGWLYEDDPFNGLYLALDPDGANIRFIPKGQWESVFYYQDEPKASFAKSDDKRQLEFNLAVRIEKRLDRILSRIDHNRLRRLGIRFRDIAQLMEYAPDSMRYDSRQILPVTLDTRNAYTDLLDELKNTGMADLILQESDSIRAILSKDTLPQIDRYLIYHSDLEEVITLAKESNQIAQTQLGENLLKELPEERIVNFMTGEEPTDKEPKEESEDSSQEKKSRMPKILRIASATGKLAVGGALAVTNVSLGVIAGGFTVIPSLGIGTVGAAVGIVGSCYTGLNTACDALKDIATILEAK